MLIKVSTEKTVKETAVALENAVEANHFGIMQVHDLKESIVRMGVEFARECLVFEVRQSKQAKTAAARFPCRISMYQEDGKTVLATLKPTALLEMFKVPQLEEVVEEVETAIVKIINEAAKG